MSGVKLPKIWVTGGTGFLGQHVLQALEPVSMTCVTTSRPDNTPYGDSKSNGIQTCDLLRDKETIDAIVKYYKPDVIIHLAASVGGIGANMNNPGKFMYENLQMGMNILESVRQNNPTTKIVNVGTVCSYPKYTPIPFMEEDFWNGYPEETNAPYGIAKKALIEMSIAYEKQYGIKTNNLILANLYGPGDSLDLVNNHVVPAMIKKFLTTKDGEILTLWGDGTPTRDFLFVKDAAHAIFLAATTDRIPSASPINIGTGVETSMFVLSRMIANLTNFDCRNLEWNRQMPNGQPRRVLDTRKAAEILDWRANTRLIHGLEDTVRWMKCQLHA